MGSLTPEPSPVEAAILSRAARDLGVPTGALRLRLASEAVEAVGGSRKYFVLDLRGRALAFALCSTPASPDLVARNGAAARRASELLGRDLGEVPLVPSWEGDAEGLSFIGMPVLVPLGNRPALRYARRRSIEGPVLRWLRGCAARTLKVDPPGLGASYGLWLERLSGLASYPPALRDRARAALEARAAGRLRPVSVLMHGDLWEGNIMLGRGAPFIPRNPPFRVIDWPGALEDGFPFVDLTRFAMSFKVGRRRFLAEVERHCEIVGCGRSEVSAYLMASFGRMSSSLDHFPFDRFVELSRLMVAKLESAGL